MPDSVAERKRLPGVKDNAERVSQPSGDKPDDSSRRQGFGKGLDGENNDPTHQDISQRRDYFKPVDKKYFQSNADQGQKPDDTENRPSQRTRKGDQEKRGVGAGNQDVDA